MPCGSLLMDRSSNDGVLQGDVDHQQQCVCACGELWHIAKRADTDGQRCDKHVHQHDDVWVAGQCDRVRFVLCCGVALTFPSQIPRRLHEPWTDPRCCDDESGSRHAVLLPGLSTCVVDVTADFSDGRLGMQSRGSRL